MPCLLLELYWSFFKIGLFSFGGGYGMIPLMESELISHHGWLTAQEFIDIIAVAEMTPGPIAVNSATYAGFRMAGMIGSAVATLGVISPSLIILLALGSVLMRLIRHPKAEQIVQGLRAAVIVLIVVATVSLGKAGLVDWTTIAIAAVLFTASITRRTNPFILIAAGAILGLLLCPR